MLFPELAFYTNDSWGIIRGVANAKGFPILLMNRYGGGILYVITMPENLGDLYNLPQGVTTEIKRYLQRDFPVRLDAPRPASACSPTTTAPSWCSRSAMTARTSNLSLLGAGVKLRNLTTGRLVAGQARRPARPTPGAARACRPAPSSPPRSRPHSYAVYRIEK